MTAWKASLDAARSQPARRYASSDPKAQSTQRKCTPPRIDTESSLHRRLYLPPGRCHRGAAGRASPAPSVGWWKKRCEVLNGNGNLPESDLVPRSGASLEGYSPQL